MLVEGLEYKLIQISNKRTMKRWTHPTLKMINTYGAVSINYDITG